MCYKVDRASDRQQEGERMKHVVNGIILSAIAFMVIAAVMIVSGRSVRKNELEKALAHAVKYTMENLNKEESQKISREEFIQIFTENLSMGIESDSKVWVSIMKADTEKGILSVRAEEEFYNLMGKEEKIQAERTVILENYNIEKKKTFTITYRMDGIDYKVYTVTEGSALPVPVSSEESDICWIDEKGCIADSQTMIADSDKIFIAK